MIGNWKGFLNAAESLQFNGMVKFFINKYLNVWPCYKWLGFHIIRQQNVPIKLDSKTRLPGFKSPQPHDLGKLFKSLWA